VFTEVHQFQAYPQSLAALQALAGHGEGSPFRASALVVRYRSTDSTDAHVEVIAR
jgi:hypothetical protein